MNILSNYGEHIFSFGIFTANSVILASKLTNKIPQVVPNLFRSSLSYLGIISFPFHLKMLEKNVRDLSQAIRLKESLTIVHTALKITLRVVDIFFLIGGTTATFLALTPLFPVSTLIFGAMIPFAMPSLILTVGLDVLNAYEDRRLLTLIDSPKTIVKITAIIKRHIKEGAPIKDKLALQTLKQFSHLDIKYLKETSFITEEHIKSCLKTRLLVSNMDLSLQVIGYLGLSIGKLYPNSLAQASFNFGISLLYNIKYYVERRQTAAQEYS